MIEYIEKEYYVRSRNQQIHIAHPPAQTGGDWHNAGRAWLGKRVDPPEILYHGTGVKYAAAIDQQGLLPKSRLYVHLSADPEMAYKVGQRHGKPVIYIVKSGGMHCDGIAFYKSVNGVWLTKAVPVKYLEKQDSIVFNK